jgi:hypothetical protein
MTRYDGYRSIRTACGGFTSSCGQVLAAWSVPASSTYVSFCGSSVYEKFEKLGVAEVKARLASKVFLGAEASLAQEWLAREETKAADEAMAINRDSNRLGRLASTEARNANKIALAALAIAVVSMIISVIATLHGWK